EFVFAAYSFSHVLNFSMSVGGRCSDCFRRGGAGGAPARPAGGTALSLIGVSAQRITLMLCAWASSVIAMKFCSIISSVVGPVLRAMSFVPARITTAAGLR